MFTENKEREQIKKSYEEYNRLLDGVDKTKEIMQAFKYHYENNEAYKKYCKVHGVSPEIIMNKNDIRLIPLIPSDAFKRNSIVSCKSNEKMVECTSSGTKGSISTVYRDHDTLNYFIFSCLWNIKHLLTDEDFEIMCLLPQISDDNSKHLWMAYVGYMLGGFYESYYLINNNRLDVDLATSILKDACYKRKKIAIFGSPSIVVGLAQYIEQKGEKIDGKDKIFILTAGGWKNDLNAMTREQFNNSIKDAFNLNSVSQIRDSFNMVELNSIVTECEVHTKHILPYMEVNALDPANLEPYEDGQPGVLSFIDPMARSFPCFILSDDIGVVKKNYKCQCGRTSDIMIYIRRFERSEDRGCALKMNYSIKKGDE